MIPVGIEIPQNQLTPSLGQGQRRLPVCGQSFDGRGQSGRASRWGTSNPVSRSRITSLIPATSEATTGRRCN